MIVLVALQISPHIKSSGNKSLLFFSHEYNLVMRELAQEPKEGVWISDLVYSPDD